MAETRHPADSWKELASRVARLLEAGRLADAERVLDDALVHTEVPAGIWSLAGIVALRRGDADSAITRLERAEARNPGSADTLYNLGVALLQAGRDAEALARFQEALARRPGHVPAAANLAEGLTRDGRYREATRVCREALDREPRAGHLWLALGEALRRSGDLQAADASLGEALRLRPRDPDVLNRLGILRKAQDRVEAAQACYRQAIELAPERPGIHNNLGLALLAQRRPEQALAAFDEALRLRPGWPEALVNRSAALARAGRQAEAETAARQALAEVPDHPAALAALAALLSGDREPERHAEAERLARRALALDPELTGARDTLGIVLMKLARPEEALAMARAAVSRAPREPDYAEHLADHLGRLRRLDEAARVLVEALRHNPDATVLSRQLGIVRLRQDAAREALGHLERRLASHPRDQRAITHRAVALERLGRAAEARRLLGIDRFIRQVRIREVAPFPDTAAFNRALARDIREHPTLQWEPVGLAARGGALTGELLDAPTEAIRVFERNLRRAIDDWLDELDPDPDHPFLSGIPRAYRLNTWATLVPGQGEISPHFHEASWLSGAYYPRLPETMGDDDSKAGWIEFGRPSAELPPVPEEALRCIRPEEGLLLLFPSYLFHRTLPFSGEGERISVSFDVELVEDDRREV